MQGRTTEFHVTEMQRVRLHLRLAAHEGSGPRLSYRFGFFLEREVDVTCNIYYVDDESNSMRDASPDERMEIYEGRIALGMDIIHRALKLADLPGSFAWTPILQFVLHEACGMGGEIVYTTKKSFTWPANPSE